MSNFWGAVHFTGFYGVDFYFSTTAIVLISLAFFNYENNS